MAGKKRSWLILATIAIIIFYAVIAYFVRFDINPDPYLIKTGFINLKWYGALIAFAVFLSYIVSRRRYINKRGKDDYDLVFLLILTLGLAGARIGFVIQNLGYFSNFPNQVFFLWQGGLSIHGGIIGGLLGVYLSAKLSKLSFIEISNVIAPELLTGVAIGRFGNFFNQEIIGSPTNGTLKMFVEPKYRPAIYQMKEYFHPVFLYESFLLFAAYMTFLFLYKKLKSLAVIYVLISYNAIRFIVEFFRIDYKPIFLFMDLAQLVSLGIIFIALLYFVFGQKLKLLKS